MRHARRLSFGSIGAAALTLVMVLSGCGAAVAGGQGAVENVATAAPTSTPFPTATEDTAASVVQSPGCPPLSTPTQPAYVAVGALSVSIPQRLDSYPSALMPNNAPSAPYQVPLTASELQVGAFHPNPPVNPQLASGYVIQICDRTGAAHALTGMSVRIASFTPRGGAVTAWHICQDGPYDAATRQTTPGCGGGFAGARLTATLSSDSAGASASVTGAAWPVTIGPNQSIVIAVAVNGLSAQGVYTLSFGVSVDGAAPVALAPSDGSFLMAPSATVWTGTACETSAMLAQIPASSQDAYYVCPPAA